MTCSFTGLFSVFRPSLQNSLWNPVNHSLRRHGNSSFPEAPQKLLQSQLEMCGVQAPLWSLTSPPPQPEERLSEFLQRKQKLCSRRGIWDVFRCEIKDGIRFIDLLRLLLAKHLSVSLWWWFTKWACAGVKLWSDTLWGETSVRWTLNQPSVNRLTELTDSSTLEGFRNINP